MNSSVRGSMLALNSCSPANTSVSESCLVEPQHVSITVFLCLVFLVGFFLNSFSLWVFCCRFPKWSSGTVLQFHLALSDAIVTPVTPLMAAYFALGSHWPFGNALCRLMIALLTVHFYGSILFLTLISIHRYVAVVHFNKSSCIKQKGFVQKLCGGVWLFMLVQGIVCLALFRTNQVGNRIQCLSIHQGHDMIQAYFIFNFILLISGFLLPFSVTLGCYVQLARSVSRINMNTSKSRTIKSRSLKMMVVCLGIFGICFTPLNVIRTVGVVIKKYFPDQCRLLLQVETAYYVSWIMAGANCCLDPLLYCFGSQNFVTAINRSLRRFEVRFEANHATMD